MEFKLTPSFLSFFIPRKGSLATPLLIDINILVFILMVVSGVAILEPSTLALMKWGADFGPLTLTGDWWRMITCNFIHIGGFHLLMNMYAFLYVGFLLESLIGARRMFIAYLLTGLCSAALSLYIHPDTISAGASGSIFGLYGIFLALLLFKHIEKEQRKPLLVSILIFVGYNLVYGMKDGIDNAAHIGGLVSGFLLGVIYSASLRAKNLQTQKTISYGGEVVLTILFLCSIFPLMKDVPADYREFRNEWNDGIIEAYLNGELKDEEESQSETATTQSNSNARQQPIYRPATDKDTWLPFQDAVTGFSCTYPTHWANVTNAPEVLSTRATPPLLMLINGGNQITITAVTYETYEEFERANELSRHLPKNEKGETAEGYHQSDIYINGLKTTRTENPLHIGAPDEEGEDVEQVTFRFAQEKKRCSFTISTIIKDEVAKDDLSTILDSIQL